MGAFDEYSTHVPILAALVARTEGAVLELGMGEGSSPFLHYACRDRRLLVSADYDESWAIRYAPYRSALHEIHHVTDWAAWRVPETRTDWAVALLDHSPGKDRADMMPRLLERCRFVVVHDTERDHGTAARYQYELYYHLFKHHSEFRHFRPYTAVLSNVEPFEIEECDRVWSPPT